MRIRIQERKCMWIRINSPGLGRLKTNQVLTIYLTLVQLNLLPLLLCLGLGGWSHCYLLWCINLYEKRWAVKQPEENFLSRNSLI